MRTVKVLTVKQPWAFLLIAGIKDVENRSRVTNYRGELFIHASVEKSFDWDALTWLVQTGKMKEFYTVIRHFGLKEDEESETSKITEHREEFGAILGSVNLTGCIPNSTSPWAMHDSKYHWLVSDAKPIQPIPAMGSLSLWNYQMPEEKETEEIGDRRMVYETSHDYYNR